MEKHRQECFQKQVRKNFCLDLIQAKRSGAQRSTFLHSGKKRAEWTYAMTLVLLLDVQDIYQNEYFNVPIQLDLFI